MPAFTYKLTELTGLFPRPIVSYKVGPGIPRGGHFASEVQIALTRLTNAFSKKKWENLWAVYCLHFAWYNFVRIHMKLRVTPAMEAGITAKVWMLRKLLEAA